ncbi:MAG: hypothetical protein RLZZ144_125 [Pseudomonadota bacterium]
MKLEAIRMLAASMGIPQTNTFKTYLIKNIQAKEGNFDCYGSAHESRCDQINCRWREDCFKAASPEEFSELD